MGPRNRFRQTDCGLRIIRGSELNREWVGGVNRMRHPLHLNRHYTVRDPKNPQEIIEESPPMKRMSFAALAIAWATATAAQEPISIGVSIAQSPPGSVVQGTQVKDGLEIVKDMVNAQGGVNGRKIQLVYEDNQGI